MLNSQIAGKKKCLRNIHDIWFDGEKKFLGNMWRFVGFRVDATCLKTHSFKFFPKFHWNIPAQNRNKRHRFFCQVSLNMLKPVKSVSVICWTFEKKHTKWNHHIYVAVSNVAACWMAKEMRYTISAWLTSFGALRTDIIESHLEYLLRLFWKENTILSYISTKLFDLVIFNNFAFRQIYNTQKYWNRLEIFLSSNISIFPSTILLIQYFNS